MGKNYPCSIHGNRFWATWFARHGLGISKCAYRSWRMGFNHSCTFTACMYFFATWVEIYLIGRNSEFLVFFLRRRIFILKRAVFIFPAAALKFICLRATLFFSDFCLTPTPLVFFYPPLPMYTPPRPNPLHADAFKNKGRRILGLRPYS